MDELKNLSDHELVERIVRNDQQAFKQLYYNYYHALYRFAYYRTHSEDIASDLVQDLFFTIWEKRANLKPEKSVKAYLYTSLNNRIINYNNLVSSHLSSLERCENVSAVPGKIIDEKIDITEAINTLPENLRTVFTLSRFDGFKYAEIAEICEISIKAVEKRMNQAFRKLRDYLKK